MDEEGDHFDDSYDDDIPWADPSIRTDYEAALGRLILAHNEVDLRVTQLIERCLDRLDNPPPMRRLTHGMLGERLRSLDLLKALPINLELDRVDLSKLHQLNNDRNVVAHGHFEQNPFDGDYVLIGRKKRIEDYPTERLDRITADLQAASRQLSVLVDFYDPPDIPQPEPAAR